MGGWPAILGTLPAATLADDILGDHPDRLRGLVVIGGDPAAALPDTPRVDRALDRLELLVAVDLFANATGRRSDVLLPAATWLERDEIALHTANQRPLPHLRLDRRVVAPRGQARTDWRICLDLCRAVGRPAFGSRWAQAAIRAGLSPTTVGRAVARLARIPWRDIASAAGHLGSAGSVAPTPRLAIPEWCAALAALADPDPGLRLVTSVRSTAEMNHWIRSEHRPLAWAHPDDAPPGPTRITSPAGHLDVSLRADPHLARGTVVIPFGQPALNPNRLVGTDRLEPFTGQPVSNGTLVTLGPPPGLGSGGR